MPKSVLENCLQTKNLIGCERPESTSGATIAVTNPATAERFFQPFFQPTVLDAVTWDMVCREETSGPVYGTGGVKRSGFGREGGRYVMHEYLEVKSRVVGPFAGGRPQRRTVVPASASSHHICNRPHSIEGPQ